MVTGRKLSVGGVLLLLSLSRSLFAQTELPPVVVTADKREVPEANVSASVTVVTREEIERQAATTVEEVLRNLPGVDLASSGTGQGDTNVRIRGSDTDQVVLMIDGVPIQSTSDHRPLLSGIPVDNVERIEVVRGSYSALYGSDAVGGVINIITRKGTPEPRYFLTLEGGNLRTFREVVGASASPGKASFSVTATRTDQGGRFSRDRFGQLGISTNFSYEFFPELKAGAGVHYYDTDQEIFDETVSMFDPAAGAVTARSLPDVNASFHLNTLNAQAGLKALPMSWWEIQFSHGFLMDWQRLKNPAAGEVLPPGFNSGAQDFTGKGYVNTTDLRNFFTLHESPKFAANATVGFEIQDERFRFTDPPLFFPDTTQGQQGDRQNYAPYLQQNFLFFDETLILSGGVRFDHNTTFGNEWSPRASVLYKLQKTGTTFRGSYGEGFHGPTILGFFDQVLAQRTGSPTFQPILLEAEQSQSYEAGVEQKIGRWADLGAAFFYIDYDRLLDGLQFVQDAYSTGFEAEVSIRPIEQISFGGNYTLVKTRNEVSNTSLFNRPTHRGNFFIEGKPLPALSLRADVNVVSKRSLSTVLSTAFGDFNVLFVDSQGNALNTLGGYVKVDLAASYEILKNRWRLQDWKVYFKVENLLDDRYRERFPFDSPGITFLTGTRVTF